MKLQVQQRSQLMLVFAGKRDNVPQNQPTRFPRATRPLPLKLVTVGKDRGPAMESVAVEYVKKIQRYCAFEEVQLRPNPKNSSDVNTQVSSEGDRVMRTISTKDWVVLLDERGKEMTSEKFADLIADAGETVGSKCSSILYRRAVWAWTASAGSSKCECEAVDHGAQPSSGISCAARTDLQGVDNTSW